jgi:hypothetical protein
VQGGRTRGRCRCSSQDPLRPKWMPGRASPWRASLFWHSDDPGEKVEQRGRTQVDKEELEKKPVAGEHRGGGKLE